MLRLRLNVKIQRRGQEEMQVDQSGTEKIPGSLFGDR